MLCINYRPFAKTTDADFYFVTKCRQRVNKTTERTKHVLRNFQTKDVFLQRIIIYFDYFRESVVKGW